MIFFFHISTIQKSLKYKLTPLTGGISVFTPHFREKKARLRKNEICLKALEKQKRCEKKKETFKVLTASRPSQAKKETFPKRQLANLKMNEEKEPRLSAKKVKENIHCAHTKAREYVRAENQERWRQLSP